ETAPNYSSVAPVDQGTGSFSLYGPAGQLRVGVILAPGSQYSFIDEIPALKSAASQINQSLGSAAMAQLEQSRYEQPVSVSLLGANSTIVTKTVSIALAPNDAHIKGPLRDQAGNPLKGVDGVVVVVHSNGSASWQSTDLN